MWPTLRFENMWLEIMILKETLVNGGFRKRHKGETLLRGGKKIKQWNKEVSGDIKLEMVQF